MAEHGREETIGARIASARRARGFRTTKELATAMEGTGISAAILENIESGRKASLDVTHVLNIAMALGVPVSFLLAPMVRPGDPLDLPNLSDPFRGMSAAEFDSWLSGIVSSGYQPRTAAERNDRAELSALRELAAARRELGRLEAVSDLEASDDLPSPMLEGQRALKTALRGQINSLTDYLKSAGWEV